jgi:hypothetical protein
MGNGCALKGFDMHRFILKLPLLLVFLGLTACAAKMETEVTRFHQLPAPAGETIEIEPANPANRNSLEFNQYADLVGSRLGAFGYKLPVKGKPSDLVARIDYGVSQAPGAVRDGQNPVSVGFGMGVGGHHSSFGMGMSTAVGGSTSQGGSYQRWLTLQIDQLSTGKRLFEGRAVSQGKTGDLGRIMPYLVNAMFSDFPGQSGVVKNVTVNVSE